MEAHKDMVQIHPLSFSFLVFLASGCASPPSSPVAPGTAASVTFVQVARGGRGEPVMLRLFNQAGIAGGRPQDLATKVCRDPAMDNLLAALAAAGFFDAARPGPPASTGASHIHVATGQGHWTLAHPSSRGPEGRLAGEDLAAALQRFQTCSGLMLSLYNGTFDLVPIEVEDGAEHFRAQQEKARQAGAARGVAR